MDVIKNTTENILKDFGNKNFKLFIKDLLTLRTEVLKTNPEGLELGLVDLIMDDSVFDWLISAMDREPTEYDWEAAGFVARDLKSTYEIMNSDSGITINI